jgi:hypothetical protein
MNYIFFFGFLIALCIIDFNVVHFLYLQFKRLELAIEKFFFRIRLEWDIFIMRYNKRKYLKMAKEILEDLTKDEQV